MTMRYGSDAHPAVHETVLGLNEAGLTDGRTMEAFDAMCLTSVESPAPEVVRAFRLDEKARQTIHRRLEKIN